MGFIFRPDSIDAIVSGNKAMTRRIVKPGEFAVETKYPNGVYVPRLVIGEVKKWYPVDIPDTARLKWQVGRDYAVSPGRGKPGVWWQPSVQEWCYQTSMHRRMGAGYCGYFPLRIRITAIRQERLQDISYDDARAEGAPDDYYCDCADPRLWYANLWSSINARKGTRWQDNPLVWVLQFEVVK